MYIYAYIGLNNLIAKHYTEAHSYIVKHSRRRRRKCNWGSMAVYEIEWAIYSAYKKSKGAL